MLVWLADYLVQYHSIFNVVSYLTVRSITALLTALLLSLWIGPKVIRRLQMLQIGQVVRHDGPEKSSSLCKRGYIEKEPHHELANQWTSSGSHTGDS